MVSSRVSVRSALRISPLLVLSSLLSFGLPSVRAHQLALPPLPLELVQSWCYHVQQDACAGSWSQSGPNEVLFAGEPGVCDVAFAVPRAVRLDTAQGASYHLWRFTSDPLGSTSLVYV